MSTNDVPGAKAHNSDVLDVGCWAEHEDGSLIFVKGIENAVVIFEMYDLSKAPDVTMFTHATPEDEFKIIFSWKGDRSKLADKIKAVPDIRWTWHDKTPFPWDSVIKAGAKDGISYVSADDQLSAAERVGAALKKRGLKIDPDTIGRERKLGIGGILRKVANMLDGLDNRAA